MHLQVKITTYSLFQASSDCKIEFQNGRLVTVSVGLPLINNQRFEWEKRENGWGEKVGMHW